ncbi:unnamed protein product [Prunus brigantina]
MRPKQDWPDGEVGVWPRLRCLTHEGDSNRVADLSLCLHLFSLWIESICKGCFFSWV